MAKTAKSIALVLEAAAFAAARHNDQRRKDKRQSPYINHPLSLAKLLAVDGGIRDVEVLAAALLHDTVEGTVKTKAQALKLKQEIAKKFGRRVLGIVLEVTDDKSLEKAVRKRLQIEHAAHASRGAKLVKLADKISNVGDVAKEPPADWNLARKREYFDWAKQVVDQVRGTSPKLERLFDKTYAKRP